MKHKIKLHSLKFEQIFKKIVFIQALNGRYSSRALGLNTNYVGIQMRI